MEDIQHNLLTLKFILCNLSTKQMTLFDDKNLKIGDEKNVYDGFNSTDEDPWHSNSIV
jgi:hypothetical protein